MRDNCKTSTKIRVFPFFNNNVIALMIIERGLTKKLIEQFIIKSDDFLSSKASAET